MDPARSEMPIVCPVLIAPFELEPVFVGEAPEPEEVPLPELVDDAAGRVDDCTGDVTDGVTVAVPTSTVR